MIGAIVSRPNCKLCGSTHRAEAEALVRDGGTLMDVHRWLRDNGEAISYSAVKNHFAQHYLREDVQGAVGAPPVPGPADILGTIDIAHTLIVQQVTRLGSTRTDERNIGTVSAALFRGLDLLVRNAEMRARLLGYFDPPDELTLLQVTHLTTRLQRVLGEATEEQRALLEPVIAELAKLDGLAHRG